MDPHAERSLSGPESCTYSPAELQEMIEGMKRASGVFYRTACAVGNHAFIEFAGLMNEYIKLCCESLATGADFTETNIHTGKALARFKVYEAAYLGEKFGCIFGTTLASAELKEAFAKSAFR